MLNPHPLQKVKGAAACSGLHLVTKLIGGGFPDGKLTGCVTSVKQFHAINKAVNHRFVCRPSANKPKANIPKKRAMQYAEAWHFVNGINNTLI